MNIYAIFGHNPNVTSPTNLDIAEKYDFSLHKQSGKLILNKKGMEPTIDMRNPQDLEIVDFTFGHLTIETPIFMEWLMRFVDFCDTLWEENRESLSKKPFDTLLRAISNFSSCNTTKVRSTALEFAKWKSHAERFGPDAFFGGYEMMEDAFITARNNGGVWFKHM
jgi:hypothetical protein